MRDIVAYNAPAPQAPARNSPQPNPSILTYNSHRKIKRPLLSDKKVYRPIRKLTLSRIDEIPRPRSKSIQHSTDFSSTRPMMRSRSNVSADTSRSVPVCNQSQDISNQMESVSPQYAEPKYDSGSDERPASMMDLPIMVPMDPLTGAYIPYPEYAYYHDDNCRFGRYKKKQSKNNLFLAFMY